MLDSFELSPAPIKHSPSSLFPLSQFHQKRRQAAQIPRRNPKLPPLSFVDYYNVGEPALLSLVLNFFPLSDTHSDTLPIPNLAEKRRMRRWPNHPNTAPSPAAPLLRTWKQSTTSFTFPRSPCRSDHRPHLRHPWEPPEHRRSHLPGHVAGDLDETLAPR
jgi:hypothetical protein